MQALRLMRPRGLQPLLRLSTTAQAPSGTTTRVRTASAIPLSNVEAQWEALSSDEQLEVHRALEEVQKKDWKTLSVDEKKAGTSPGRVRYLSLAEAFSLTALGCSVLRCVRSPWPPCAD